MSGIAQALFMGGGPRNITYVGGTTGSYSADIVNPWTISLTSLSGGIGSEAAPGDIVVVYYGVVTGSDHALSATGYTQVAKNFISDSYGTILYVGYKFMGGTADTTIELSAVGGPSGASGTAVVQVWRNVNSTTPMDVTATTSQTANTALANPPAITPVTPGAVIVAGGTSGHNAGNRTFGSSDLTAFLSVGVNATSDSTTGAGYSVWTSGAVNPAQFTFSGTDSTTYSSCAVTLALRPA